MPPIQLAGRVSGAPGAALRASASTEPRVTGPVPCSRLQILLRTQGRITPALEIRKPYTIAVEQDGTALVVALALIGFVSDWLEELTAALIHARRWLIPDAKGSRIVDRALTIGGAVPVPAPWSWL